MGAGEGAVAVALTPVSAPTLNWRPDSRPKITHAPGEEARPPPASSSVIHALYRSGEHLGELQKSIDGRRGPNFGVVSMCNYITPKGRRHMGRENREARWIAKYQEVARSRKQEYEQVGVREHWETLRRIAEADLKPWEQAVPSAASGGAAGEGVAVAASGAGAGGGESTGVSTEDAFLEEFLLNPYPSEV